MLVDDVQKVEPPRRLRGGRAQDRRATIFMSEVDTLSRKVAPWKRFLISIPAIILFTLLSLCTNRRGHEGLNSLLFAAFRGRSLDRGLQLQTLQTLKIKV